MDAQWSRTMTLKNQECLSGRAGDYPVAWHAGHISTIRSTWLRLFNDGLPHSSLTLAAAPGFERYDACFDDSTGHAGVEIWQPLCNLN